MMCYYLNVHFQGQRVNFDRTFSLSDLLPSNRSKLMITELKGHKRKQGRNKNPQSWQTVIGTSPKERSTRAIYWAITFGLFSQKVQGICQQFMKSWMDFPSVFNFVLNNHIRVYLLKTIDLDLISTFFKIFRLNNSAFSKETVLFGKGMPHFT